MKIEFDTEDLSPEDAADIIRCIVFRRGIHIGDSDTNEEFSCHEVGYSDAPILYIHKLPRSEL